jgi:hypothetical protein
MGIIQCMDSSPAGPDQARSERKASACDPL